MKGISCPHPIPTDLEFTKDRDFAGGESTRRLHSKGAKMKDFLWLAFVIAVVALGLLAVHFKHSDPVFTGVTVFALILLSLRLVNRETI